jgi:hypothetical protein
MGVSTVHETRDCRVHLSSVVRLTAAALFTHYSQITMTRQTISIHADHRSICAINMERKKNFSEECPI